MTDPRSQSDKFRQAARARECDEAEARWDATLRRVAKQKPDDGSPEEKAVRDQQPQ